MRNAFALVSSMLMLSLVASACGGSDKPNLQPPSTNLAGVWQIDDSPLTTTCQSGLGSGTSYTMTVIHQTGSNSFTATGGSFDSVTGTIDGNKVSFASSASTSDCTPLTVTVNVTLDSTGNTASGSSSWTCNYTGGNCSGTDKVTATRQ